MSANADFRSDRFSVAPAMFPASLARARRGRAASTLQPFTSAPKCFEGTGGRAPLNLFRMGPAMKPADNPAATRTRLL